MSIGPPSVPMPSKRSGWLEPIADEPIPPMLTPPMARNV